MKNLFNEDYYERGVETGISGYSNYRWIPELTIPMCARLVEMLKIKDSEKVLDFGCAKGFMVKAFRLLHKQAWGYDISDYARDNCDPLIKGYLYRRIPNREFDWVIAKDVFEHIPYDKILNVFSKLNKISKKMFIAVPLGDKNGFVVPSYNTDVTHCICESLAWWVLKLKESGFVIKKASYNFPYLKENYSKWKQGNGFIVVKRKGK